ncbi:KfrA protein [Salmonella enterica subsp. enterica serovar Muenchen]|nr:KfrA protein [Salmonella enterica subsp. enterica serovar Muenchen]EJH3080251.1 DNA-binding protein [Salmonella enterica]ELL3102624.1 DNA-binding protein [Salmonella enterica]
MALSQDMRERIFAAADALFAASETGEFPNVEAVRQESRAGMNYVVEAMKEWRQNQRRQVMTVRDPLPPELHTMIQEAGQHFWTSARQLANESLDAARSAFESEKNDLIQLSAEQSAAFERQATELAITLERLAELERLAAAAGENEREMSRTLEATREARQRAEQEAALSRLQAEENARRADELRAELEHAHREAGAAAADARTVTEALRGDAERLRTERDRAQQRLEQAGEEITRLTEQLTAARGETAALQTALAEVRAQNGAAEAEKGRQRAQVSGAETARDEARQEAAAAREAAARLRGELEAVRTQNAALLAALKSPPDDDMLSPS